MTQTSSEVENKTISINLLDPHKRNYRKHPDSQLHNLTESLKAFGQTRSIVVRAKGDGRYTILAGHGITEAARRLKFKDMRCDIVPETWTDQQALAYIAADNQAGFEDDLVLLAELLEEIKNDSDIPLEALGHSEESLAALLDSLAESALGGEVTPGDGGDEFDPDEEGIPERCRSGDLWLIGGKHRLLVGDSTNQEDVNKLFQNEQPTTVITDVPYGISQKSNGLRELDYGEWDKGDCTEVALKALSFAKVAQTITAFCGDFQLSSLLESFKERTTRTIAWIKPNPTVMNGEHVFLPALELAAHGRKSKAYFGGNCVRSVWEGASPQNRLHPTQKPIGLFQRLSELTCPSDGIIYDPFLGGGTSIIAAHRTDRKCYGMEKELKYADCILARAEAEGLEVKLIERIDA